MLVMFALTVTASLAGENLVKGLIAGAANTDRTVEDDAVGVGRFDFGSDYLLTGTISLPYLSVYLPFHNCCQICAIR